MEQVRSPLLDRAQGSRSDPNRMKQILQGPRG